MTQMLKDRTDDVIRQISHLLGSARKDLDMDFSDQAVFSLESLLYETRELVEDLAKEYADEAKARPGYDLALRMHEMYREQDPYGFYGAREIYEDDEHYIFRCSAETCEDIEALEEILGDLEEMAEGNAEDEEKVRTFRRQLDGLKAAKTEDKA